MTSAVAPATGPNLARVLPLLAVVPLMLLGAAGPGLGFPLLGPALALVALAGAGAIFAWGREAPLLVAVAMTPLIPVGQEGLAGGLLGTQGGNIRAASIAALLALFLVGYVRGLPPLPASLRPVVGSLIGLAGAGLFAAVLNSKNAAELGGELAHGIGQPVIYGVLILCVAAQLRECEGARERLLAAFSVAILLEGLVVAVEFATGAAFDQLRGITRAQGTVGADFLAAMAMLGFFCGLSLRVSTNRRRFVVLGTTTMIVSVGILALATTRGGVIGAVVGIGYLLFTGINVRSRAHVFLGMAGLLIVVLVLPPVSKLWSERLSLDTVTTFDRTATWVSGVRMGIDDPLSGLGSAGVEKGIATNLYYRDTPYGASSVVPHNIWILAFAEGGIANLVMSLIFSAFAAVAVWRRPRRRSPPDRYLVAGLISVAIVALINNLFTHPEVMIPSFVVLTILASGASAERESSAGRRQIEGARRFAGGRL